VKIKFEGHENLKHTQIFASKKRHQNSKEFCRVLYQNIFQQAADNAARTRSNKLTTFV
jgi:hypothetical protein